MSILGSYKSLYNALGRVRPRRQTHRPTDRLYATPSATTGRIYLVLQFGLIKSQLVERGKGAFVCNVKLGTHYPCSRPVNTGSVY